jgi:hypothetical protein
MSGFSGGLASIASGYFFLDRYDEGRWIAKESMQPHPNHQGFASYIVNCVGCGDMLEANKTVADLLKFDPSFCVSRAVDIFPIKSLETQ